MGKSVWTDAMIARLKVLHSEDKSFEEIARQLRSDFKCNLTRNAAIGRSSRLGLSTRQRVTNVGGTAKRAYKPAPHKRRKSHNRPAPKALLDQAEALAGEAVSLPPDQSHCAVSLMKLDKHHCRWPIDGAGGLMMYCGANALEGGSYCPRHHRLAYHRPVRITPEERQRRIYHAKQLHGMQTLHG